METKLKDILREKKPAILKRWFDAIMETYPAEAAGFLKGTKNRFTGPVGYTIYEGIDGLIEGLIREVPFESEWKRVSGRMGGIESDGAGGATGQRKEERPEVGEHEKTLKASGRAADRQPGGGDPLLRRPAGGCRRQAHAGTGSGKRAGGPGDRVQE